MNAHEQEIGSRKPNGKRSANSDPRVVKQLRTAVEKDMRTANPRQDLGYRKAIGQAWKQPQIGEKTTEKEVKARSKWASKRQGKNSKPRDTRKQDKESGKTHFRAAFLRARGQAGNPLSEGTMQGKFFSVSLDFFRQLV